MRVISLFSSRVMMMRSLIMLSAMLFIAACGKDSGLSGKGSVWDTYDFRHPVPYGAPVPDSRATVYDQYQDYEEYYTPPKGYVQPAPVYRDYEEDYVPPRGYSQPAYAPPRQQNYNPCIPGDPGCIAGR